MPEFIEIENHGPIREVAMNRPKSLNALNLGLMTDLADAMTDAAADPRSGGAFDGARSGFLRRGGFEMGRGVL